ncbi:MAG: hypothetical protein NZ954_08710 [Thermofilaceae archaeon]|nr:hypothetical protein [Thermofilaceae archaeon]
MPFNSFPVASQPGELAVPHIYELSILSQLHQTDTVEIETLPLEYPFNSFPVASLISIPCTPP